MHLTKQDIENTAKIKRINLITSVSGIKSANLIGTKSSKGELNLAIFSSVVHLGSNPALLGFMLRPQGDVRRHTFENIEETGLYTINHVGNEFIRKAHYTSTKFPEGVSEFEACQLTPEFKFDFQAPFVKESQVQLGMKFIESHLIKRNNTLMVVGEIVHLSVPDHAMDERGFIDLAKLKSTGIGGLNSYYAFRKIGHFPYARLGETPDFSNEEKSTS
jgi:flavin reductase (DIM6/NTAB) family NADH-FMN oxidoreductase RutF